MTEYGWLIESVPRTPNPYLAVEPNSNGLYWTCDHHSALRFGRECDARAFLRTTRTGFGVEIVQHSWG